MTAPPYPLRPETGAADSVQHPVRLRSSIALAAAPASKCTVQTANSCRVSKQIAAAAAKCIEDIAAFKDF